MKSFRRGWEVTLILFLFNAVNHGLVGFSRHGRACFLDPDDTERTNLHVLGLLGSKLWRGKDFPAQGVLDESLEGRPPLCGEGLGFDEQSIVDIQGSFHIWVTIWFYGYSVKLQIKAKGRAANGQGVRDGLSRTGPRL